MYFISRTLIISAMMSVSFAWTLGFPVTGLAQEIINAQILESLLVQATATNVQCASIAKKISDVKIPEGWAGAARAMHENAELEKAHREHPANQSEEKQRAFVNFQKVIPPQFQPFFMQMGDLARELNRCGAVHRDQKEAVDAAIAKIGNSISAAVSGKLDSKSPEAQGLQRLAPIIEAYRKSTYDLRDVINVVNSSDHGKFISRVVNRQFLAREPKEAK